MILPRFSPMRTFIVQQLQKRGLQNTPVQESTDYSTWRARHVEKVNQGLSGLRKDLENTQIAAGVVFGSIIALPIVMACCDLDPTALTVVPPLTGSTIFLLCKADIIKDRIKKTEWLKANLCHDKSAKSLHSFFLNARSETASLDSLVSLHENFEKLPKN